MGTSQESRGTNPVLVTPTRLRVFLSAARYLAGKAITILLTIFLAIFVTLLIVNYPVGTSIGTSPFEQKLEEQIQVAVSVAVYRNFIPKDAFGTPLAHELEAYIQSLRDEAGLDLPFLPRHLLWTFKALTFNWGRLESESFPQFGIGQGLRSRPDADVVLEAFPNTLLLVGTAYLLTFLIGMPVSLYLARNYGSRLDRIFSVLSPISSVPSWVFAALLITIFAVQLRWLPVGGMFDFRRPDELLPYVLALLRHMVLPVSALLLSLLFQLVYTWRTFFIIYSEEDYVDLARAKGLSTRTLEKQYILRPALPYILTSFATSLIGFWQLTVALERIFQWPGIGFLYIDVLPNYWQERMEVGDLMIVVQIVVIFSYVLGILVFMLDLAYVIVDPRIHLVPSSQMSQTRGRVKPGRRVGSGLLARMRRKGPVHAQPAPGPVVKRSVSQALFFANLKATMREIQERGRLFVEQLRRYPSAMFGLTVITILVIGSIYAVTFLPYEQIGFDYGAGRSTGRNLVPRTAAPIWFNAFSITPRLSTLIMGEEHAQTSSVPLENGWVQKTQTFEFDYSYRDLPSDFFIYLDSKYKEKIPLISMRWTMPDGRTIDLRARAMGGEEDYDLQAGINLPRLLRENPEWKNWVVTEGQYPTPVYHLLFAKANSAEFELQKGIYQLEVTSLLFEPESDVQPQFVLLGQVYGLAGTDFWRRDLLVPLLWGMPFTLLVGFWGTFITTLIAMLLPAIGVWFGGGLDHFIQRLTEVNMVLPGLALAVLINAIFGVHIWIVLGIVVVLNAFGAPIKSFRSAFLQAREAPYIEMARSYGASNSRIILRYLIPRILPILIPTLVTQIPSFIFLEATLGFFNIRSIYPTWGRIIYDGLSRGALYGSPFWVLQPIFLLLLTGLAFAMLGSALERILNPRVLDEGPVPGMSAAQTARRRSLIPFVNARTAMGLAVMLLLFIIVRTSTGVQSLVDSVLGKLSPSSAEAFTRPTNDPEQIGNVPAATPAISSPTISPTLTATRSTPTQILFTATLTPEPTLPTDTPSIPASYTLQRGEYPYCIARRFDVDPGKLLRLNGIAGDQKVFTGMVLQIPENAPAFPGDRQLLPHPTTYIVSSPNETLYTVACKYGDLQPEAIAQANQIPVDSDLVMGQELTIP